MKRTRLRSAVSGFLFAAILAVAAPDGWFVVATATDSDGSTSEFSQCFGMPSELIFADGFESGETALWSATES